MLRSLQFCFCCFPKMGGGASIKKGGWFFNKKIETDEKFWENRSLTPNPYPPLQLEP